MLMTEQKNIALLIAEKPTQIVVRREVFHILESALGRHRIMKRDDGKRAVRKTQRHRKFFQKLTRSGT